jgi:hypothetical protein
LKEIETELPNCYIAQENEKSKLRITPKMTEKLLILLNQLGYENPKEVLLNFVNKFGVSFLLQSLTYFCRQPYDDERKEILVQSTWQLQSDDGSTRQRLLKLLSGIALRGVSKRCSP